MKTQILFIVLFALNLALIWGMRLSGKFRWYRLPGNFIFAVLPLLTVLFPQPLFDLDYFWWKIAGAVAIILG
ncbi:MAG: hypothetical protein PHH14_05505, partial [Candidatus Margulisbacteria bacterium]|nr:hypothetical protein [Candidatus Margulisiibacteriota bacterium]